MLPSQTKPMLAQEKEQNNDLYPKYCEFHRCSFLITVGGKDPRLKSLGRCAAQFQPGATINRD